MNADSRRSGADPEAGSAGTQPESRVSTVLRRVARLLWPAFSALVSLLLLAGSPQRYAALEAQFSPAETTTGLSAAFLAGLVVTLEVSSVLFHLLVAAIIVRRRPHDAAALFVAYALVANGALIPLQLIYRDQSLAWFSRSALDLITLVALFTSITLLYLFPDGRFVPRWTRIPAAIWAGLLLVGFLGIDGLLNTARRPIGLQLVALLLVSVTGVGAQLYRYRRFSCVVERQQTKWAILGLTAGVLGPLSYFLPFIVIPTVSETVTPNILVQRIGVAFFAASSLSALAGLVVVRLFTFLFPLSFAISILRYRLWDIDILISRTLVYGGMTAGIFTVYVLVVWLPSTILRTQLDSIWLLLLATVLVAALAQPLRNRLQQAVNRLMYGERDDPATVLNRLSERLEDAATPGDALPAIADTIQMALRAPYAAVTLLTVAAAGGEGERRPQLKAAAEAGEPIEAEQWPLVHQGETLGYLLVAPRAPGEGFSAADERLLRNIARQAAEIAHNVRLADDLLSSRTRLVNALEEERRRIRRDLHDGLGPTLAGVILQVDAAAQSALQIAPAGAANAADIAAELQRIKVAIQEALLDIRRLVYNLRPPSLDQFGLAGALAGHVEEANRPPRLHVVLETPVPLPPLPAAVEVAAYRIALEALTNVARHAEAKNCRLTLAMSADGSELVVEVCDDGRGLQPGWRSGVGVAAMRERVAELGGTVSIGAATPRGTEVHARLPVVLPGL